jgi:membrane associated rhomboid family serine protease
MIPLRDTIPSRSTPVVTILIIIANAFVFLYMLSLDPYTQNHFIRQYALVPARLNLSALITSLFLHGGWMHIIGNMWFLWVYGDNVEDILGHGKYLVFYLLCGVIASATQYAISPDSQVPVLGASGAIAGVMGAYLIKFPHSRILTLIPIIVFWTTIEIPAVLILVYWFVLQFFSGIGSIGYSQAASQGGVAFFAHIGGFIAGMILVSTIGTKERYSRRRDLQW